MATKSQSVDQQYYVKDQFLNKIMCFDPVWYDDLVSRAGWKGASSKILENDYKTPFSVVLGCKYWTIKSSASVFKRDPLLNKWAMLEVLYFAKWVKKMLKKVHKTDKIVPKKTHCLKIPGSFWLFEKSFVSIFHKNSNSNSGF